MPVLVEVRRARSQFAKTLIARTVFSEISQRTRHLAVLVERQQAALNRQGINIEDVTGNTTGSPAPPTVWSTPHIQEILIQSSRSG
jgi:hypothetical protein